MEAGLQIIAEFELSKKWLGAIINLLANHKILAETGSSTLAPMSQPRDSKL